MAKKKVYLMGCGIFLFIIGFLQFNLGERATSPQLSAQTVKIPSREYIITIKGELSDNNLITDLDPRELRVGREEPVTWINESPIEVRMKFGKGTQCKKVRIKTFGWRLEPDQCYETEDALKTGYSTTIRFKEVGLFSYEIEYGDKTRKEKGVIRVQSGIR
jgi:hypothetical protein